MKLYRNATRKIEFIGKNEAILLLNEANLYYFTLYSNADAAILITEDKKYYICDKRVADEANEILTDYEIVDIGNKSYVDLAVNLAKIKGIKRLGVEQNTIKYRDYLAISNDAAYEIVNADDIIDSVRRVKEEYELEFIKKAQAITDIVFDKTLDYIKSDITECELKAFIDAEIHSKGGKCAFDTIVAFGENTSKPHAHSGNRKLRIGDPVTIDFGAAYHGYCSDMTRSFCFGQPSKEYEELYNIVSEAQNTVLNDIKADMCGKECHEIAVKCFENYGMQKYFTHSLGHSLGVEIHEHPVLSPKNVGTIPEGAVTSIEPGLYIPGKFGVRIEDIVVFRKFGVENLTNSPKNLIIIK